jgi:hypothetical protein
MHVNGTAITRGLYRTRVLLTYALHVVSGLWPEKGCLWHLVSGVLQQGAATFPMALGVHSPWGYIFRIQVSTCWSSLGSGKYT